MINENDSNATLRTPVRRGITGVSLEVAHAGIIHPFLVQRFRPAGVSSV